MNEDMLNTLILKRFCGVETYPVESTYWCIWDKTLLDVSIWFEKGTNRHEDAKELDFPPSWDLYFDVLPMKGEDLRPGMIFADKDNKDGMTNFWFDEEFPTYNNHLEVLDRDGDRILCRITGECCDVDVRDGSKGMDSLELTVWIQSDDKKQKILDDFLTLFPEYRAHFHEEMRDSCCFPDHIFYADTINLPLIDLLKRNDDPVQIKKYVDFIEHMWRDGDESDLNVISVTVLEQLSDDQDVWRCLGTYISEEFRDFINHDVLVHNIAMRHVKTI